MFRILLPMPRSQENFTKPLDNSKPFFKYLQGIVFRFWKSLDLPLNVNSRLIFDPSALEPPIGLLLPLMLLTESDRTT
jgi:hypothetical protein